MRVRFLISALTACVLVGPGVTLGGDEVEELEVKLRKRDSSAASKPTLTPTQVSYSKITLKHIANFWGGFGEFMQGAYMPVEDREGVASSAQTYGYTVHEVVGWAGEKVVGGAYSAGGFMDQQLQTRAGLSPTWKGDAQAKVMTQFWTAWSKVCSLVGKGAVEPKKTTVIFDDSEKEGKKKKTGDEETIIPAAVVDNGSGGELGNTVPDPKIPANADDKVPSGTTEKERSGSENSTTGGVLVESPLLEGEGAGKLGNGEEVVPTAGEGDGQLPKSGSLDQFHPNN